MAKFSAIIKSLRIERGITQEQLAALLKVSRSTIGMYEHEQYNVITMKFNSHTTFVRQVLSDSKKAAGRPLGIPPLLLFLVVLSLPFSCLLSRGQQL